MTDACESAAQAHIDLDALVANYQTFRQHAPQSECAAVVKADGYGLGMRAVAAALAKAGCRTFFVAQAAEGEALRSHLPDADTSHIYVLNGLPDGAGARFAERNLRPCLTSLAEIQEWVSLATPAPSCLQLDTGMNRLGLAQNEWEQLSEDKATLQALSCSLIMSHLACADEPKHKMNQKQHASFVAAGALLQARFVAAGAALGAQLSLSNSAGAYLGAQYHFDMLRVGIGLYGGTPGAVAPMRPVVRVVAPVLQLRSLKKGATIGYGATYTAAAPMTIALVPVGYADGMLRSLGRARAPFAHAYINGQAANIIGRISMDLLAVDVTALPEVRRNTDVELLGGGLESAARIADTISYELLVRLGSRLRRVYHGERG